MVVTQCENTLKVKNYLLETFQDDKLDLIFRMINTADRGSTLEYLDVEHKIDSSYSCGFFTEASSSLLGLIAYF